MTCDRHISMKHLVLAAVLFAGAPSGAAWAIAGVDFASHSVDDARAAIDDGKFTLAKEMLEELLRFEPDNPEVSNLLGYTRRNLGDLEGAMASYQKALALDPAHKGTLEYQGELFLKLGDKAAAEKNLARLRELCPTGCEALEVLEAAIERFKDGDFAWTAHRKGIFVGAAP